MTTATVVPIRREFQVHRFDPIKHGALSRHIALPWEDRDAFEEILRVRIPTASDRSFQRHPTSCSTDIRPVSGGGGS